MIKRILIFILAIMPFMMLSGQDVNVRAYVNTNEVGVNQQFTLNVELSGAGANKVESPQLPDMKSFAAFLGSGSSQNIQFINNKTTITRTISYHYQALKEGSYTIGPVTVKTGKKSLKTDPIAIKITKAVPEQVMTAQTGGVSDQDLFLQAEVSKRRVYENEPVVITYKIYYAVDVNTYRFANLPSTTGFWVEEYDLGRQPQTSREVVNGRQYFTAPLKKMALYPMSSGTRTIEPLSIVCDVRVKSRSRDVFNDFFNDSFFGRSVSKTISSKPVNIEVLPVPEEGRPSDFNGTVGNFSIKSTLDKTRVKTNEALTLRITIEGQGNMQAVKEPALKLSSDFEVYPPRTSKKINHGEQGISGSKTFEYVLIPRVQGSQKIKPVSFSFFNPRTKSYQTETTREWLVEVEKGDDVPAVLPGGLTRKEVNLLGADIRFIKTEKSFFKKAENTFYRDFGFWAAAVLPLMALLGAFGLRRHQDKLMEDIAYARGRRATGVARKRLSSARSHLDVQSQKLFYEDIHKALTGYLADKLNVAESGMISSDAETKLTERGIPETVIASYFECLRTCDMIRFSPAESTLEEMRSFMKEVEDAMNDLDRELNRR